MSRLYEALKGASRPRSGPDELWEALDINGVAPPPATPRSGAEPETDLARLLQPDEPGVTAQPDSVPPMVVSPALHTEQTPQEFAKAAQAALDRSARLLPYAANPTLVDHYRRLRTKILQQRDVKPFRSLVVTSAAPQEGKSLTVMNLALSFSTLPDFKVVVVDGDMRRGTLGLWLGVSDRQVGLSNLIDGSATLEDVVLKSDDIPMHFMVRGNAEVRDLHPSHFSAHFQRLSELYDLVLIDSPPANLLADVQILAANSDAVLLVARAFSTTRKSLEKAVGELAPFRIIGTVLNAGLTQRSKRYYGYY